ncbi:methylated-DNA--[protein]-cysteine S-methyltransferase [Microbacterium thalassium]|uniref:Methylated-DNA-[protein]-cysteine S-methyltransferase n=1 Tax=Microbacterium thalassium TaxID=362649 RepID=A0A7X0FRR9_9MICO|nr:methylated-DNA--[protein]-cysteine S-methyltransferase [Microbacterium thalassium]MBB6392518.1 methylated-DNA-[protein]-cysteine S-methyltransferase [Microbacterium thalassium]GLK23251.1 methylated-DNA--protein-cysteine methyltransferase [Microbacterium thalassium]
MESAMQFSTARSPIGDIVIVTAEDHVVWLHPAHGSVEDDLAHVAQTFRADIRHERTDAAAAAIDQLDGYFAGDVREFDVPLDWRLVKGFTREALQAVCGIPYGETAGYGEVAILAGRPRAARAVGTACANTPFSLVVPVHRVVRADGTLGEYGGRPELKRYLIDLEQGADPRLGG